MAGCIAQAFHLGIGVVRLSVHFFGTTMSLPGALEADLARLEKSAANKNAMTRAEILACNNISVLKAELEAAWARADQLAPKKSSAKPSMQRRGFIDDAANPDQDAGFREMSATAKRERTSQAKDGIFSIFARIDVDGDSRINLPVEAAVTV